MANEERKSMDSRTIELMQIVERRPDIFPFAMALVTAVVENPDRSFTEIAEEILTQFGFPAELALNVK